MKVLQVHNFYQIRGGEDGVLAMEKTLLENNGIEVDQFTLSNKDITGLFSKIKTVFSLFYSFSVASEFKSKLREFRPDVVHVHNTFPAISPAVFWVCSKEGVAVVQTIHNYRYVCPGATLFRDNERCEDCITKGFFSSIRYKCYRNSRFATASIAVMLSVHRVLKTLSSKVDRFIVLSVFAKLKLEASGMRPEQMIVKPNFKIETKPALVLPTFSERSGVLFVGRLSEEKGIMPVLEKWPPEGPPLTIVGDGPLHEEIQTVVSRKKNVIFRGKQNADEVASLMKAASVLLFPSLCYEGFPMVMVEAMSFALPIVCYDIGSMSEIVEHGDCGVLIPFGMSEMLIEEICLLAEDEKRHTSISQASYRIYQKKYTDSSNITQLLNIYKEAQKNGK